MADTKLFVINTDFDGGRYGEIIEADPKHIADWIDADFVSPVDERGERIITVVGPRGGVKEVKDEGAAAAGDPTTARVVTQDDVAPAG